MMKAYLHFGGAGTRDYKPGKRGPQSTLRANVKETELPISGQTLAGYGRRIPTSYMVEFRGRWRRVYVCNFGNAGTAYIGPADSWIAKVDIVKESE